VTATGQKLTHTVSLKEVLTKAADAIDFEKKWKSYREAKKGEKKRVWALRAATAEFLLALRD